MLVAGVVGGVGVIGVIGVTGDTRITGIALVFCCAFSHGVLFWRSA